MQLELVDITLGYRGDRPLAVGLNGAVAQGESVALVGRNGVGKSTLLRSVAGLVPLAGGEVRVDGRSVFAMSHAERARTVSFVSTENVSAAYLNVEQVVAMGRAPYSGWAGRLTDEDRRKVVEALEAVDAARFVGRSIDRLSDGQRQRVMVARALAQDTPVVVLDEPTAFLDWDNRRLMIELLGRLAADKIILYSTHELDLAHTYASRVWSLTPENGLTLAAR